MDARFSSGSRPGFGRRSQTLRRAGRAALAAAWLLALAVGPGPGEAQADYTITKVGDNVTFTGTDLDDGEVRFTVSNGLVLYRVGLSGNTTDMDNTQPGDQTLAAGNAGASIRIDGRGGRDDVVIQPGGAFALRFILEGGSGDDHLGISEGSSTAGKNLVLLPGGPGSGAFAGYGGPLTFTGYDDVVFEGSDGDDVLTITGPLPALVRVLGRQGRDTVQVVGSGGPDTLTANDTTLFGLGPHALYAGFEAMEVFGQGGNDALFFHGALIPIGMNAAEGDDILVGGRSSDLLIGGPGNDTYVFVRSFENQLDAVEEGPGPGSGRDRLDFSPLGPGDNVTVNLKQDNPLATHTNRTVKTADPGQAVNFEEAIGGSGNDSLFGNDADNYLVGGPGNDGLDGSGGNDALDGGLGNDAMFGSTGSDLLLGGLGAAESDHLQGGPEPPGSTSIDTAVMVGPAGNNQIIATPEIVAMNGLQTRHLEIENLFVHAQGGSDVFDVLASPTTTITVDGAGGSDRLTFHSEGLPFTKFPNGYGVPGKRNVFFAGFEQTHP